MLSDYLKKDKVFDFKNYNTWMYKFSKLFENNDNYEQAIEKFKKIDNALYIKNIVDSLEQTL